MIGSLILGAFLFLLGARLLFRAQHTDALKNKEIALETIIGYAVLVVAFLCGVIAGLVALNTNNIIVSVVGAVEASASAIVFVWYFISWMDGEIKEGHPSN